MLQSFGSPSDLNLLGMNNENPLKGKKQNIIIETIKTKNP